MASYKYKISTIYLQKTVAILLRLYGIQLFWYYSETKDSKIIHENFIKLASLLFELFCTKVRGMRFSVQFVKKNDNKGLAYIHKIIEDNTIEQRNNRQSFIYASRIKCAKSVDETHFLSFTCIVSTRDGTDGFNFHI